MQHSQTFLLEPLEERRCLSAHHVWDVAFGDGGTVRGPKEHWPESVFVQPDGKIVVAANPSGAESGTLLLRYNANGSLDTSFSRNGRLRTKSSLSGLSVTPTGQLAATAYRDERNYLIVFHADGRRDTSVAKIPLHFAASDNTPTYAFQSDGKVLTAGSIDGDFVVSRYHPDGALDESFGTAGRVSADFGHDDRPAGVGVQPDGTIIVGGISRDDESVDLQGDNGYGSFALAAYDPDGSVADFGENGRLAYKFYAPHSNVTDFIIDSQGNIAMAGWGGYGFGGGIIHINAAGTVRRNALWETTRMWDLAFAGDNRLVAFSTDEGELKRFHLNSGSEIKLKLHAQIEFHIGKMAVAPDGDVIIATYDGRRLYVKRMQG